MLGADSDVNADAREWHATFFNHDHVWELHRALYARLSGATSVFEFGCGTGKNLAQLAPRRVYGIDTSEGSIAYAKETFKVDVAVGDDRDLPDIEGFDAAFTCSVLCHIPEVARVVAELKRIAPLVVLAETLAPRGGPNPHWYAHDYASLGFTLVEGPYIASGLEYFLWEHRRP